MAFLGDIDLVAKPVTVRIEDDLDRAARVRRWWVRSLDVYGSEDAPRFDLRVVFSSNDAAAVRAMLDGEGYVPGSVERTYRLHDVTCGACSAYVPLVVREWPSEGWHEGREYRRFGGRLQILRVRCPAHPFDVEESVRVLSEAGLL